MENSLMMDNDSGYVSHHQESNLDSLSDNAYKTRSCTTHDLLYLSEDALLEQPTFINLESNSKRDGSFDSVLNSSQESVKTEYSGFNDSDHSDASFIVPQSKPLVWDSSEWKENSVDSIITSVNTSKDSSFVDTPKKKVLTNVTNTYDRNINQAVIKNVSTDKENIHPSETPKKQYENRLTSNISPDLFSEEEEEDIEQKSPMKKGMPKETNYSSKDTKLLKNVQNSLNGVHPPPSVTIVQISVTEMLDKIGENKHLFWKSSSIVTNESKSLLISSKPDCVHSNWPEILKSRYHGLHFNRNKTSEDFEHLCLRYAERYIGAETQSSCTVFDANPPSSHKRKLSKPRWGAKSPGRRLSHLARRRITFSSANLQASSSSAILGSRARQILVDARKLSMLKKSPKKSPRKTPSKSPYQMRKNTPSSSAKKKLALRFRQMSGEFENIAPRSSTGLSFKSALFSNENDSGSFGASMEKKSTKRALFSSPIKYSPQKKSPFKIGGLDKKRKRTDFDCSNPSKFPRSVSLDMQATRSETKCTNRTLSESSTRSEELSDQHKKKLQWAVYESLRLQNITPTHPQFKVFASILARVTRKFLPNLRYEGRTTEKMFRIARHHSYAVVKGKSVDEIVNEFMKNRLKNQKPQGYIGIEGSNKENDKEKDKENVLQDKVNIIKSIEKRREHAGSKSIFISQNRIDRIKKVISFEEKDG